MKKLTPVLYVESIEPALPFWEDRLGFQRVVEVPRDWPATPSPTARRRRGGGSNTPPGTSSTSIVGVR